MLHRHEPAPTKYRKKNGNSRRDFLKLPLAERRQILLEQARRLLATYHDNEETSGMGGGDLVDY